MNKSIRLVSLFSIILSALLLINLTNVQVFSDQKYAQNPKNMREYLAMQSTPRGQIYAKDTVLAQSTADAEGLYSRSSSAGSSPHSLPATSPSASGHPSLRPPRMRSSTARMIRC